MRMLRLTCSLALILSIGCATATPGAGAGKSPGPVSPAEAGSRKPGAGPAAPAEWKALRTWAQGAVFYEVFVRSFQDTNGDGKGDLPGLIAKLDYLNDGDPASTASLGVDALWLMPVFNSPSYHGYDTIDYDVINPDYGTNEDLARLCAEAHKRGLRVVVDMVLNHTSSKHPWFVESASSPQSPRRDWYVWSATDQHWGQPWNASGSTWHKKNDAYYYGLFWAGMPDLNFRTPAVREEAKRIAKEWLDRGVDGFRLDAARHLIETGPGDTGQNDTAETHAFWREFSGYVRSVKPEALLIGETWTKTPIIARYYGDTSSVAGGDELPLNFDFPLAEAIVKGVQAGDGSGVALKLAEIAATYPAGATDVPFLTNHDQKRVASELADDAGKLRSAAAVLLTLPGTPFIYYGEELGLDNGPGNDDEFKRTPMPWDATTPGGGFTTGKPWYRFAPGQERVNVAAEEKDPGSLLTLYRKLIHLRHATPALAHGDLKLLASDKAVLAFTRTSGAQRVLVVHNLGGEAAAFATPERRLKTLFATFAIGELTRPGAADGGLELKLPPHASAVFVAVGE